jgi:hypothetical protein
MFGRRIVPILLTFGLVHMLVRHGPLGQHGEWEKRVPPIVEKWHQRMHEAQQPTTPPAAA